MTDQDGSQRKEKKENERGEALEEKDFSDLSIEVKEVQRGARPRGVLAE